jgi:septal ring factor EnvC (AmiA/AmiB activator)
MAQAAPARPDHAVAELKAVHGQIEKLKKELAANESQKSEAADALKESELAISEANRTLEELNAEREATADELAELESAVSAAQASIQRSRDRLATLLRTRYKAGEIEAWRLLLNQQDPNTVSRELAYYRYLAQAQQALAQRLKTQLDKLDELASRVRRKHEQLERIASEKHARRKELQSQKQQKQALLSKLDQKIGAQRNQIQKLAADEKRLTSLIERLEALTRRQEAERQKARARQEQQTANTSKASKPAKTGPASRRNEALPDESQSAAAFTALKGKLRLPARGEIVGRFGAPRNEATNWKGIFIKSAEGQPVKSVASGHVIYADWLRGFGNILIVDHGGGYISLYSACESVLKKVGDPVKAGDTIATTGNSGGMGDSGVYFEIRQNGKPLDPMSWAS